MSVQANRLSRASQRHDNAVNSPGQISFCAFNVFGEEGKGEYQDFHTKEFHAYLGAAITFFTILNIYTIWNEQCIEPLHCSY